DLLRLRRTALPGCDEEATGPWLLQVGVNFVQQKQRSWRASWRGLPCVTTEQKPHDCLLRWSQAAVYWAMTAPRASRPYARRCLGRGECCAWRRELSGGIVSPSTMPLCPLHRGGRRHLRAGLELLIILVQPAEDRGRFLGPVVQEALDYR